MCLNFLFSFLKVISFGVLQVHDCNKDFLHQNNLKFMIYCFRTSNVLANKKRRSENRKGIGKVDIEEMEGDFYTFSLLKSFAI